MSGWVRRCAPRHATPSRSLGTRSELTFSRLFPRAPSLRQGKIRSYIALNVPPSEKILEEGRLHNETWSYYPDDRPRRYVHRLSAQMGGFGEVAASRPGESKEHRRMDGDVDGRPL